MTDVFDRGQAREEEMRADALAEQQRRSAGRQTESATHCSVCDDPIPEGRRMAVPGTDKCIDCQKDAERARHWDWGMGE